jgi:Sec-independent protein secretion pathway component TatC
MRAIAGGIALPASRRLAMLAAIIIGATTSPRPAPAAAAALGGLLASLLLV